MTGKGGGRLPALLQEAALRWPRRSPDGRASAIARPLRERRRGTGREGERVTGALRLLLRLLRLLPLPPPARCGREAQQ